MSEDNTRRPSRKPRAIRPSTAPEKPFEALLPPSTDMDPLQEDETPLNLNLDNLPPSTTEPSPASNPSSADYSQSAEYDWATFIHAYACGRWDPHRTPRPPLSSGASQSPDNAGRPRQEPSPVPQGALAFSTTRSPAPEPSQRLRASFSAASKAGTSSSALGAFQLSLPGTLPFNTFASSAPSTASAATTVDAQTTAATLRWAGARVSVAPLSLPSPEHELVDPMRGAGAVPIPGSYPDYIPSNPSATHSRSNSKSRSHTHNPALSHLSVSSVQTPGWDVMTPGGTRRSRLSGFWSGTADVDDPFYLGYDGILPTIEGSPSTPDDRSSQVGSAPGSSHASHAPTPHASTGSGHGSTPGTDELRGSTSTSSFAGRRPAPATAPLRRSHDGTDEGDYFHLGGSTVRGTGTRRRGRVGLRTPPATREGSQTREGEAESERDSQASGAEDASSSTAAAPPEPKAVAPTTPDSDPLRPNFGRAQSATETSSSTSTTTAEAEAPQRTQSPDEVPPVLVQSPTTSGQDGASEPSLFDPNLMVASASEDILNATNYASSLFSAASSPYPDPFAHDASLPHSVPAPPPRRTTLTRQTSAPLPVSTAALVPMLPRPRSSEGADLTAIGTKPESASPEEIRKPDERPPVSHPPRPILQRRRSAREDARAAREERAYAARGFLAPPFPPDELGRRRALYKFNIINTAPDLNFDRIAHLAKLVFNTKGVLISVVDAEEEWFKSEWGINKIQSCSRAASFAAHAILQRGEEPLVVLDSRLDWRFAKSPLVQAQPNTRFYAAAPLRTQEGFNIGCLALIDDTPREEFTPRQRHTLKEFAAIAMREMELWRDKIQIRIRDRIQSSMEQFSRECLEIDNGDAPASKGEGDTSKSESSSNPPDLMNSGPSMDTVYDRAAKLVQRTLDVEGVVVIDVSHFEVLESMNTEGSVSIVLHHGDPDLPTSAQALSAEEYGRLNEFFMRYPDGKIAEGIMPAPFRPFLPPAQIQYALLVPIYNIDKRPFALICAWNTSHQSGRFLEGHELSYLRAIGVIILSAVLKRRMILADKAKGLFISNISHELRTPLHGILAAAELLGDSQLSHSQMSFLQTVQACGASLVETVNHVLDFTKLSGNSKAGGVENVIVPSNVDLMQLVEEAVDGCWIGHRARAAIMGDNGIGSVYSPPQESSGAKDSVEPVVEIGWRKAGWNVKCEKGGIRRVLMNVFGNSLKFTSNGYVHVILRELPRTGDDAEDETKIELVVHDTGKGISENFRKNQLFHPFSQENPLQTGTGLGLAIVNSIVKSESVNGKVDVWSEEGVGTEIKVSFSAQVTPDEEPAPEMEPFKFDDPSQPVSVSLVGFDLDHQGVRLLRDVVAGYLSSWWGFEIRGTDQGYGDIVVLNEDVEPVKKATAERDTSRPFIVLSTMHGIPAVLAVVADHENIGGFCRVIYKPGGPSRLYALLKLCVHTLKIGHVAPISSSPVLEATPIEPHVPRRNSEETSMRPIHLRPMMTPRSTTAHPLAPLSWRTLATTAEAEEPPTSPSESTVNVGDGGTLLKSSMGQLNSDVRRLRVLVVEDNLVLRTLLIKWLTSKGHEYRDAVDGRHGVRVYQEDGPFDVILLDMSMPILDGLGATTEIRQLEAKRLADDPQGTPTRILALTGRSSLEDKRRAFDAGVDGYLVKPVAFKTLDEMFAKLGVS